MRSVCGIRPYRFERLIFVWDRLWVERQKHFDLLPTAATFLAGLLWWSIHTALFSSLLCLFAIAQIDETLLVNAVLATRQTHHLRNVSIFVSGVCFHFGNDFQHFVTDRQF